MRTTQRLAVPSFIVLTCSSLAACTPAPKVAPAPGANSTAAAPGQAGSPAPAAKPPATPAAPRVTAPPSDSLALALAARARADSIAAIAAAAQAAAEMQTTMRGQLTAAIPFDPDSARVSLDARTFLDQKVAILVANPTIKLRLTGHAYERGSEKDNVALGLSRAESAKRYMVIQGIDANRIETVGHAEAKPAAGSSDASTAQLRIGSFEITAAPPTLTVP